MHRKNVSHETALGYSALSSLKLKYTFKYLPTYNYYVILR